MDVKQRTGSLMVILPAYNEEGNIQRSADCIAEKLEAASVSYRILYVDDGSTDKTWECIQKASEKNPKVRGLHFSRNFGKEGAIFAALCNMDLDCCVVMDADLQHPVDKLWEMYHLWELGYDVVEGVKTDRGQEGLLHKKAAGAFYNLMSWAAGFDMKRTSDFKLLDKNVVDVLVSVPERKTFFRAMSFWAGFRRTVVEYDVLEREAGESKWSTRSLVRYALNNIGSFTEKPMYWIMYMGIAIFLGSVIYALIALIRSALGHPAPRNAGVIFAVLLTGSMIMIAMGIMGFYIARIFDEVRQRPRFIISEACGSEISMGTGTVQKLG
uniref:glycosyltransferase family 2 protein n=1 Tax=Eubacterium cellulosolvens TaxID=29322 RepID=UPI000480D044|nr:glycosyltransferase family 2 protein [[Eubacterium] cellulosolvens]